MNEPFFFYRAFGLLIKSCIEHPDFIQVPEAAVPDCTFTFGEVPKKLTNPDRIGGVFQVKEKAFLLRIEHVGRYLIRDGNNITIDKSPDSSLREVIIFLWASAMAVLLHQRGVVIVHGSAIKFGDRGVIFSGPSGSGKSTIATTFAVDQGGLLVSDDITAISLGQEGRPVILPGYPMIKLWRDSSEKIGIAWDDSRLVRDSINKMTVNINSHFFDSQVPLHQIYLLSYKNEGPPEISEMNGYRKIDLLMNKIFRKNYLDKCGADSSGIFTEITAIANQTRICSLKRQFGIDHLEKTIGLLLSDLS